MVNAHARRLIRSNENKISDGGRGRVARSGSVEVISKVERTAVRRSLHRNVRRFVTSMHNRAQI
jgi:hypothetical protein